MQDVSFLFFLIGERYQVLINCHLDSQHQIYLPSRRTHFLHTSNKLRSDPHCSQGVFSFIHFHSTTVIRVVILWIWKYRKMGKESGSWIKELPRALGWRTDGDPKAHRSPGPTLFLYELKIVSTNTSGRLMMKSGYCSHEKVHATSVMCRHDAGTWNSRYTNSHDGSTKLFKLKTWWV